MTLNLEQIKAAAQAATPGPWRWEFNGEHRNVHLVGGKPSFDLTIIDFCRWGMCGATMLLRDTAHDGMNLMHKLHERPDWIAPHPGREHHKSWFQRVTHPDAKFMEVSNPKTVLALVAEIQRLRAELGTRGQP